MAAKTKPNTKPKTIPNEVVKNPPPKVETTKSAPSHKPTKNPQIGKRILKAAYPKKQSAKPIDIANTEKSNICSINSFSPPFINYLIIIYHKIKSEFFPSLNILYKTIIPSRQ